MREKLEAITHPAIQKRTASYFEEALRPTADKFPLYCYEIPLLFESGIRGDDFFRVVVVTAEKEIAIRRVVESRSCSRDDVLQRMQNQLPQEEKVKQADYVIDNSTSLEKLHAQVRDLYKELTALYTDFLK